MEEYTVTLSKDEYDLLVSTNTKFQILIRAIRESAFVTEMYDHVKDEPLIHVAKMVDPLLSGMFDSLREELKAKKENDV